MLCTINEQIHKSQNVTDSQKDFYRYRKVGEDSDGQKPINSVSNANHKVLDSKITLIRAKHSFALTMVRAVSQEHLVRMLMSEQRYARSDCGLPKFPVG